MDVSEILETARLLVQEWASEIQTPVSNRLDVYLKRPDDLVPAVTGLRVKRLGYLTAISGVDLGVEAGEIEVIYHFCVGPAVIQLRVRTPRDNAAVPTLSEIIPSAEPFERELSEMLGVRVVGLRTPEHLYLPDDWPQGVYPLRKDFDPAVLTAPES